MQHRVNVTLAIDADTLRHAKIRALEQGTSVNAVVRSFLETYAGHGNRSAMDEFLDFARKLRASSGARSRQWTRDDAYEDRLGRRRAR